MKKNLNEDDDEFRPEYDPEPFKRAVRGKYFEAYRRGTNVVILASDVARAFPSERAVNAALRRLIAGKKPRPRSGAGRPARRRVAR